ncbi:MAG: Fic family protein [Candidatus Margulisiibacteriota bacterium]
MDYKPNYRITPYLLNLIDEAGKLRAWIELAPLQVSWLPILQKESRAKRAHFSTSIEGNPLTLPQVHALARGEKIGAALAHELEVVNYLNAMRWVESAPHQKIDEKTIFALHKIVTDGLLDNKKSGQYKIKQNYVVDENGIRQYTPTSPKDTPGAVKELLAWLNTPATQELHSILACAIFHHRFVSIHPFSDGNGRLARAIGTLILYRREFDLHHIFSLDEFFAGNRQKYYQKLQQARELDGDLTYWIEYVAEGVVHTLHNVKKRIEGLQVTTSYPINLSVKQEETLRMLRDTQSLRGSDLIRSLKVTRARVNQILTPLIKSGLVKKEGQSKATRYKLALYKN